MDEPPYKLDCKFTYDDKKSPFIHCATPKWWMIKYFVEKYSNNNVIENNTVTTYKMNTHTYMNTTTMAFQPNAQIQIQEA